MSVNAIARWTYREQFYATICQTSTYLNSQRRQMTLLHAIIDAGLFWKKFTASYRLPAPMPHGTVDEPDVGNFLDNC